MIDPPKAMKLEKVILSFIAISIGLFVAGAAFFVYQIVRAIPQNKIPTISITNPTPTPSNAVQLSVDSPADESVITSRSLTITGKTVPDATLELTTATDDQVVTPTSAGTYSLTTVLQSGENLITITAIAPDGQESQKTFTVTSSTEDF